MPNFLITEQWYQSPKPKKADLRIQVQTKSRYEQEQCLLNHMVS